MNPNDREPSARTIHRQYKDAAGNIHTEYKNADGSIYSEYKDINGNIYVNESGYVQGQLVEEQIQDAWIERADTNMSKRFLIGIIFTCMTGLAAGFIYYLTRTNVPQTASVKNLPTHESTQPHSPIPSQQVSAVKQPIVPAVKQPTVSAVPPTQVSGSKKNTIAQPFVLNLPTKPGILAKPTQNSSPLAPKPLVTSSVAGNAAGADLNTADGRIKNEILEQFNANLPNNQLTVDVNNGDVVVSGKAATLKQLQAVQFLLGSVEGIRKFNITATAPL